MECKQLSSHKENHCNYNEGSIETTRTISKHTNLFNHIDNLAVSRNVRASSTMIKVTYNKGSKSPSLQMFDGKNDFLKMNNSESLNAPLALERKSCHLDGKIKISSAKSDKGKIALVKGEKSASKAKNETNSDCLTESQSKQKRGENENGKVGLVIPQHGKKSEFKEMGESKNIQVNHNSALTPVVLIDPLRVPSKCDSNSRKRPQIDAIDRKGKRNPSESASNISNNSSDDGQRHCEKNNLNNDSCASEFETSDDDSESENKAEREADTTKVNSSRKIHKRKSESAGEEYKRSIKKIRRSIIDDEREILFDDEHLPPGWQRFIHTRKGGMSDGQNDVHILSPSGKIFRFRGALKKYLEEEKLPYSIDDFYFGLYKRKSDMKNKDSVKEDKRNSDSEVLQRKKLDKSNNKDEVQTYSPPSKSRKCDDSPVIDKSKNEYRIKKEIILQDSNLPSGWRRCIIIRSSGKSKEKRRISFISPDGKKFKQKKRLSDYLATISSSVSIDQFNFNNFEIGSGIKKVINHKVDGTEDKKREKSLVKANQTKNSLSKDEGSGETLSKICGNRQVVLVLTKVDSDDAEDAATNVPCGSKKKSWTAALDENDKPDDARTNPRYRYSYPPMRVDPELPEGWHRSIKVRSTGESAGRMEVIINSPDGRKHRNKGALEQYLKQHKLPFRVDDFDFTLFGKNFKRPSTGEVKQSPKFRPSFHSLPKERPKEKEKPVTQESLAIGNVSGTMVACGITTVRNERRLKTSKAEHEKALKDYFESNRLASPRAEEEACDIPEKWIQDLAQCRSEFGSLQQNAASAIASATKEFLQELALRALEGSKYPDKGLEYDDVANLVEKSECLSSLKPLIPQKITFKQFIKLNRPTKFSSFT